MARIALATLVLLGLGDVRSDEFECEHGMVHLAACCPGFHVDEHACAYSEGCGSKTLPVLSERESLCIQDLDCAAIEQRDLCARVMAAERQSVSSDPDAGPPPGGAAVPFEGACE